MTENAFGAHIGRHLE